MKTPAETLDADQCAELLKCTPEQVEALARDGEIPGVKIGRGWLFIRADLLAYLAERARTEAQERRQRRAAPAQGPSNVQPIKPRRRAPPALPTVPSLPFGRQAAPTAAAPGQRP
jgi:excisionase family DNA binding protein